METGWYKRLSGVLNFEKDNFEKKGLSVYHLEGEKLGGLGEKNADEPVIYEFPSDNPSPFPPNNAPAQTSAPYVTEIPHDPPNEHKAEVHPNAERCSEGCVIASDIAESQEIAQDVKLAMPGAPESITAAADVDDVENVVLERGNAPDCAAEFIDENAGVTAIDLDMRRTNSKPWEDTIKNVSTSPRANEPMEIFYTHLKEPVFVAQLEIFGRRTTPWTKSSAM